MTDKNEMITIRLSADNRRKIWQQIKEAMRDNTGCLDFACLDTGFKVPKGWPFGKSEITLAQLIALARKLKFRIEITNLNIKKIATKAQRHEGKKDTKKIL